MSFRTPIRRSSSRRNAPRSAPRNAPAARLPAPPLAVLLALAALLVPGILPPGAAPIAAAAPPSGPWADWAEGPVRHLLTDGEKERWEAIRTEEEGKRFVDLFWSKRDPDLETPVNELKQEFDRRVAIADANFGGEEVRGSLTDRGKVLILLGEPRAAQRRIGTDQVRQPGERLSREGGEDRIVWEYDTAELPVKVPAARLLVGFYEEARGSELFVLDRAAPGAALVLRALRRAPEEFVVHPGLERPVHPVEATPPPGTPSAPAADRAAAPAPPEAGAAPDPELAGWFLVDPPPSPEGTRLLVVPGVGEGAVEEGEARPVWLQLELPADAPRVERLAVQWAPVAVGEGAGEGPPPNLAELPFRSHSLNDGVAYQAALPLPPGEYVLGVAAGAGARPTAVRRTTLELPPVPEEGSWLAPVYVAPHVEQQPDLPLGSPFLVAGWHLVPDPVVAPGQNLSYFGYLVTPPGREEPPQVDATISLSREGQPLASPFRESVRASAVRDGLWMYGSSLTLSGLPEGSGYTLSFEVGEPGSGASRTGTARFSVAAPRQTQ